MRFLFSVLLFFCSSSFANECISKADVDLLKGLFSSNDKNGLIFLSLDGLKKDIVSDKVFKNESSTLKNLSEINFAWVAKRNDGSATNLSLTFPGGSSCVWRVTFMLPKNIREQCDDDGVYGYFISFAKIGNTLKLNDFTSLYDVMDDGSLACPSANTVMMQQ